MAGNEVSQGRGRSGGRAKPKPELVVPAEERKTEAGEVNLPVRGGLETDGKAADLVGPVALVDSEGGELLPKARPVGNVESGRKKASYTDRTVQVNMKMDAAVHFALRLIMFETNTEQQYLINVAVEEFCRSKGVDPETIREGKGYTLSFPGAGG